MTDQMWVKVQKALERWDAAEGAEERMKAKRAYTQLVRLGNSYQGLR